MRLELKDLRLAAALEEFKTLTQAAQQLNLTQSALSHQLADLERRIGAPLFERTGRRLIPTQLGQLMCTSSKRALSGVVDLEREMSDHVRGRTAALRIATQCYTSYGWLPPVLEAFGHAHPSVEVSIVPEATRDVLTALLNGSVDLAVMSSDVRDRRVRAIRLFDDEMMLVVSKNHRLAGRRSVPCSELQGERIFAYLQAEGSSTFRDVLAPAGVSPGQLAVVQLTEAALELTKANQGVAILAGWAVRPHLEGGALRAVRIQHPSLRRTWKAVVRAGKSPPVYINDFVRFLAATVANPPKRRAEFDVVRSLKRA